MWTREALKTDSKTLLKLNYWPFVLVAFIFAFTSGELAMNSANPASAGSVGGGNASIFSLGTGQLMALVAGLMALFGIAAAGGIALDIFLFNPIQVGCVRYMILSRRVKPVFRELVYAFEKDYLNVVKTMFFRGLFTFLWSMLLFVPGIIKSYEYRMIPYLLAEYPDMSGEDAFAISREMMYGDKWNAFVLDLSFIGWKLLGALTFGLVNLFYVFPYEQLTDAALYEVLKRKVNL